MRSTLSLGPALLSAIAIIPLAKCADFYPEIRAIIREAELASVGIRFLNDRSNPSGWEGRLYAQAGYLDDAARAFADVRDSPSTKAEPSLWRARVIYGDLAGAEKSLDSISDPEQKVLALTSLADLLWRMGEPSKARIRFEAARQIAPKIAIPEHRTRISASIEQGLAYLKEPPPDLISATPKPPRRMRVEESLLPQFPITTDGFRELDSKTLTRRASADGEFMKKLYGRMAAGDREGLMGVTETAATPFQKALAMASIEHILIQAGQPEMAEEYARKISDVDPESSLAKAEALSAAGAAWSRSGDNNRAQMNYDAATGLVQRVKELPFGKVLVILAIATAESKDGMVSSCRASLQVAKDLAQRLPLRPESAKPAYMSAANVVHYRDDGYNRVFLAAIRTHELGVAHEVAELWGNGAGSSKTSIVRAWFDADRTDEALDFAHKIQSVPERVEALLALAQAWLVQAGAPSF